MVVKIKLLTFVLLLFRQSLGSCPSGWVIGTGDSCFKFVATPALSWQQAEGMCRDMGGSLAALDTQLKTAFINGFLIMQPSLRDMKWLIGGRYKESKWIWTSKLSSARDLTFSNWFPGEPNNFGSVEGCMELYAHVHNYMWNDLPCAAKRPYICEKHQSDVFG